MSWILTAPLYLVALITVAALWAATETGYRAYGLLNKRRRDRDSADEGYLLSAVLGLLALLLGFTFSLALNRYETKRELVVAEANAIGTTWLRAQLIEQPYRAELSRLLRAYAVHRLHYSETGTASDLQSATKLQQRLWGVTGRVIRADSSPVLSRGLMESMNESFDAAATRTAAREAHIPGRVLGVLLVYAVISTAMLGYVLAGSGNRHRVATGLMLILLTLSIMVILDLDRPRSGAIQVSQRPIADVLDTMNIPAT